ncbi:GAF domain-containing protein, partial [archaeon]
GGGGGEGSSVYVRRAQISYLFQQIQRYMQRIHNNYHLQSLFMQLLSLCSPSLTLKDIIEDTLKLVKDMLEVDRVSIYILDTSYTFMYLYTLVTSDLADRCDAAPPSPSTPSPSSSLISGLKMPLKGVAAYVAKHNLHINVTDAYQIEFFDMSMDIKTGYRTKQMLCVPIHNPQGEVVGVIQGINPLIKGLFGKEDEEMMAMVGKILASHVCDLRMNEYTSQSKLGKPSYLYPGVFTCKLVGGYMFKEHRHIKFNVHLFLGGRNPPITKQTKLYNTSQDSQVSSKCMYNANEFMEFATIRQSDINLQCSVVLEAFSKNNHPIGWVYMPLFTESQRRVRGEGGGGVEYLMIAGGMPTNWMEIIFDSSSSQYDVSKVLYAQQSLEEKCDEDGREYVGMMVMDWGVHENVYYDIDYRTKYSPYQGLNYVGIESTPDGAHIMSNNTLSSQLASYCTSCALDRPFINRLLQFFNFEQTYLSVLEIDPNIHEFLSVHGPRLVAYDARFAFHIFMNYDYQYLHKTKAVMQLLHSPALHNFSILLPLVTGSLQNNRLLTLLANSMYTILPSNEGLVKSIMPALLHCYQLDNTVNNSILYYFLHSLITAPSVFGVYAYWHVQSLLMLEPMRNQSKISYYFKDIHRLLPASVLQPVTKGFDFLYQFHMSYFKLMLSGENVSTPTERSTNVYKLMLEQLPMSPQSDLFALPLAPFCGQLFTHVKCLDQHPVFKAGTALTVTGRDDDKTTLSLIYLPSYSPRYSLYHDFLRIVDFIFSVNEVQLRTLQTDVYHIYAETTYMLDFPNAMSMQSLISAALAQASPPKTKEKSLFFKSNDFAMKKIPEDLLTQHFLSLEAKTKGSDAPFEMEKALDTYWYSLASYLLVAHVLCLQNLTGQNVLVSQQGELIAFYPSDFLGMDDALLDKPPEEYIKVA